MPLLLHRSQGLLDLSVTRVQGWLQKWQWRRYQRPRPRSKEVACLMHVTYPFRITLWALEKIPTESKETQQVTRAGARLGRVFSAHSLIIPSSRIIPFSIYNSLSISIIQLLEPYPLDRRPAQQATLRPLMSLATSFAEMTSPTISLDPTDISVVSIPLLDHCHRFGW